MAEFNPWVINDTYELIKLVETIKKPAKFLAETFFSETNQSVRDVFAVESRKAGRMLAPFIFEGINAKDVARFPHSARLYRAPMIAARRTITLNDITERAFGEQPIFSNLTPEDRAAQMQARDLVELMNMVENRRAAMIAELLQTGKVTVSGELEDGTPKTDVIDFLWDGKISVDTAWSDDAASIYDDLKNASERIQEATGEIPTIAICGKSVEKYLLANEELYRWLLIPNRQNVALMNLTPSYTQPQLRFLGYLAALGLELYSYVETYKDGDTIKPFINADTVIIGSPKIGTSMFGRVDFLTMNGDWQSAAAPTVPLVTWNTTGQTSSLTLFSRFLPIPNDVESWVTLDVSGTAPDDSDSDEGDSDEGDSDSDAG